MGFVNYSWSVYQSQGSTIQLASGSGSTTNECKSAAESAIENGSNFQSGTSYYINIIDGYGVATYYTYTKSGTSSGTVTVTSPANDPTETDSPSSSTTDDPTNSNPPSGGGGTGGGGTTSKSSQTVSITYCTTSNGTFTTAASTITLNVGESIYLKSSGKTSSPSWTNSKTSVASFTTSDGKVTALSSGSTEIKVTYPSSSTYYSGSKSVTITVKKQDQTASISGLSTIEKYVDAVNFTLSSSTTATDTTNMTKTWYSSNTNVAAINSSTGEIDIKASGTTNIQVKYSSNSKYNESALSNTVTISVVKRNQNISLSGKTVTYGDNNNTTSLTVSNAYGQLTWGITTENGVATDVATINQTTGVITIKKIGTVKVTVYAAGNDIYKPSAQASANLTINAASKPQSWSLNTASVTCDSTIDMDTAISGTVYGTKSWSVTNGTGSATINASTGILTPSKAGTVTVKLVASGGDEGNYTYSRLEKTCTVTINNKQTQTLVIKSGNTTVTGTEIRLLKGSTITLTCNGNVTTPSWVADSTCAILSHEQLTGSTLPPNQIAIRGSSIGTCKVIVTCDENASYSTGTAYVNIVVYEKQNQSVSIKKKTDNADASNSKITVNNSLTLVSTGNTTVKSWSITEGTSYASITSTSNEATVTGKARGRVKVKVIYNSNDDYNEGSKEITLYVYANQDPNVSISNNSVVYTSDSDDTKTKQLTISVTNYNTTPSYKVKSGNISLTNNIIKATGSANGTASITITCPEDTSNYYNKWEKDYTITIKHEKTPAVVVQDTSTTDTTSTTSNTPPPVNLTTPEFDIEDVTISVLNSKLSSTKDFISNLKYDSGKKAVTFEIKPKFKDSNEDKFNFTYEITDDKIINYDNTTGLFKINNNGTRSVKIKGTVKTEYSSTYTREVSRTFNITIKDTYTINTVFYIDFVPNLDKYVTCTESSIGRVKHYTFNIPPSYITNSNNPILGNITLDDGILNNPYNTYDEYYKSIEVTCNTDYIKIEKINNNEIQLTAIKYYGDKFLSIKLTHPEVQKGCYKYSKASSEIQIQTLTYNLIQYLNLRNNNIFEFDADENGLIAKNDCQYFFDVFNYYPAIKQISTVDYEIIFHTYEDDKNLIVELKKILTNNGSTIIYIYYDKTLFGFIHNNKGYPSYEPYVLEKKYSDNLYGDVKNNVLFNGIIISLNCDINVYDYTESGYIKNAEQYYNKKISLNNITNLHPGYTNIYQIKVKELIKQIGNLKLNNNTNRDYLNYYIRLNSKSLKLQYYDYHKNGGLFDCNSVISTEENSMICLTNLLYTYNDGKYISDSTNGDNNDNATLEIVIPKDYNNSENNVEIEIGFDLCITDAYNENSNMNNYAFNIKYKNNKNIIKRLNINSINKEIIEYTYNGSNYTALHFRLPKSQLTNIISNYNDIYKLLSINYTYHNSYNSISNDTTIIDYLNSYNAAKLNELYSFSKITKTINVYGCRESSLTRFSGIFDLSYKLIDYDSVTITLTAENAFDKCNWVFYGIRHVGDGTSAPIDDWTKSIIEIINYDVNNNGKCDKIKLRVYKHQDLLKLKEIKVVCTIDETIKYYKSSASIILAFDNIYSGTSSTATPLPSSTPSPSSIPASSSTPSPMTTLLG